MKFSKKAENILAQIAGNIIPYRPRKSSMLVIAITTTVAP